MQAQEITRTLAEIDGLRRETRHALQSFWFPLVVFGVLTLVSTVPHGMHDGVPVGAFWALAGPAGGIATGSYYARREGSLGLSRPAAPYVVVAVAILAGAFLLPGLTSGPLSEVISSFAVAAGYLAFAWIERARSLAALAVAMATVPVVALAVAPQRAGIVTAAATGSILLASGLAFRRVQAVPSPRR